MFVQNTRPGMGAAVCVVVDDIAWLQGGSDGCIPLHEAQ